MLSTGLLLERGCKNNRRVSSFGFQQDANIALTALVEEWRSCTGASVPAAYLFEVIKQPIQCAPDVWVSVWCPQVGAHFGLVRQVNSHCCIEKSRLLPTPTSIF